MGTAERIGDKIVPSGTHFSTYIDIRKTRQGPNQEKREYLICVLPGQDYRILHDELARATKRGAGCYISPKTCTKPGCFVTKLAAP